MDPNVRQCRGVNPARLREFGPRLAKMGYLRMRHDRGDLAIEPRDGISTGDLLDRINRG